MSTTVITSKITHKIISNMYTEKPKIKENGDMVFKKNGLLLFSGIVLVIIFSLSSIFMDDFVSAIMEENMINSNMTNILYICGYSLTVFFILIGMKLIIMFLKYEVIISKYTITLKKMFSKKTIKLNDLQMVTFSNTRGLTFEGNGSKILFGNFTGGLIEILKFIDENIPKCKCETAIVKAKKMLRHNRIQDDFLNKEL